MQNAILYILLRRRPVMAAQLIVDLSSEKDTVS